MGAGIGLFITLTAFKNAHIIKAHPVTLITIQNFSGPDLGAAPFSDGFREFCQLSGSAFSINKWSNTNTGISGWQLFSVHLVFQLKFTNSSTEKNISGLTNWHFYDKFTVHLIIDFIFCVYKNRVQMRFYQVILSSLNLGH